MGSITAGCKCRSVRARIGPAARGLLLAWVAVLCGCEAAPSGPPFADHDRGARLAAQYQCGTCHVIPGVAGARGTLAVSLEAVGGRSFIAGRIPNRDPWLARWIADPASLVPDTAMPNMGVSTTDARDIAAYLRALR